MDEFTLVDLPDELLTIVISFTPHELGLLRYVCRLFHALIPIVHTSALRTAPLIHWALDNGCRAPELYRFAAHTRDVGCVDAVLSAGCLLEEDSIAAIAAIPEMAILASTNPKLRRSVCEQAARRGDGGIFKELRFRSLTTEWEDHTFILDPWWVGLAVQYGHVELAQDLSNLYAANFDSEFACIFHPKNPCRSHVLTGACAGGNLALVQELNIETHYEVVTGYLSALRHNQIDVMRSLAPKNTIRRDDFNAACAAAVRAGHLEALQCVSELDVIFSQSLVGTAIRAKQVAIVSWLHSIGVQFRGLDMMNIPAAGVAMTEWALGHRELPNYILLLLVAIAGGHFEVAKLLFARDDIKWVTDDLRPDPFVMFSFEMCEFLATTGISFKASAFGKAVMAGSLNLMQHMIDGGLTLGWNYIRAAVMHDVLPAVVFLHKLGLRVGELHADEFYETHSFSVELMRWLLAKNVVTVDCVITVAMKQDSHTLLQWCDRKGFEWRTPKYVSVAVYQPFYVHKLHWMKDNGVDFNQYCVKAWGQTAAWIERQAATAAWVERQAAESRCSSHGGASCSPDGSMCAAASPSGRC
jgi:hypothetical protein